MKRFRLTFLALASFALLATSCGGGGGGGSDYDDARPVAESGSAGSGSSASGSTSSGSSSGSESTGGNTSPSAPEGFVLVQGTTFNGTTAITGSEVFISGRTITIPNILVCDHEVTQAEYESVMFYNPSQFKDNPANGEIRGNRPVERVSWYDAIMYCNKRSAAEGKTPCYNVNGNTDANQWPYAPHTGSSISGSITCDFSANGYRLPTEAEWEYLARGGNLTNDGQTTYSGNGDLENLAWYETNSDSKTHEVKKKDPNGKNLYDMTGNVGEWCWDRWSNPITDATPSDGVLGGSGNSRVFRGGAWDCNVTFCAVSFRLYYSSNPSFQGNMVGFRVVCSSSGSESTGSSGTGGGSSGGSGSSFVSTPALTVSGAIEGSHVFIEGRSVEIWARWCSDHEVTQIEYFNVMESSPSNSPGLNKPVEKVSWYDAITYCNRRSLAENLTPCYKVNGNADTNQWGNNISRTITCDFTADGYRLPTEAEWEYFARGGNTSNSGQTDYSGVGDIESLAWYHENSGDKSHEVKKKSANALGLYDMTGNVWEWCWDQCYAEIMITTSTPFDGFASGDKRVLRGGSWFDSADECKVSFRFMWFPNERSIQPCCGFRLVSSKSK